MSQIKSSHKYQCQQIIHEYQLEHEGQPYEMEAVAAWAVETGRMGLRKVDLYKILAQDLQKAARDEYFEDPQGRRVRRNHARRVNESSAGGKLVQRVFWDDIATAMPEHMRISMGQRRHGIFFDCKQHKIDTDSYNENNVHGAQLVFDYNFNIDLQEEAIDPTYPTTRPEGDDGIDEIGNVTGGI
jgi:hypothetical protein